MNNLRRGFVAPLILAIVVVAIAGGAYLYEQNKNDKRRIVVDPIIQPSTRDTTKINPTSTPSTNTQGSQTLLTSDVYNLPVDRSYVYIGGSAAAQYPINVTVNGQSNFPTVSYNKTFTLGWDAPWATTCAVDNAITPGRATKDNSTLANKGSLEVLAANLDGYTKQLRLSVTCYAFINNSQNVNINASIDVMVDNPVAPTFDFISPSSGEVLKRNSDPNTIVSPYKISWVSSVPLNGKQITLNRVPDGHQVYPEYLGLGSLSFGSESTQGSFDWRIPYTISLPDGSYFFTVTKLNNIPVNIRGPVFQIKTVGQSPQELVAAYPQYTDWRSQAYVEQNTDLCSNITTERERYECYGTMAAVTKNILTCELIPADHISPYSRNARNSCYYGVARATSNPSLCEKIVENKDDTIAGCKTLVKNMGI